MNRLLLPPGMRCSAYWYAQHAGLLTGFGDLEFLRCLGWYAARLARWHGIPPWQVPEGPYWVHMWPEAVWSTVADVIGEAAAEHGDWYADALAEAWGGKPPSAGYAEWRDEGSWPDPYS